MEAILTFLGQLLNILFRF